MKLATEVKKLVNYIDLLELEIPRRKPSHKHVGAIIADAVLQIGHGYNIQVKNRIARLRKQYPKAATVSGLVQLLKTTGAQKLLNGWKGGKEHKRLYNHANFFNGRGINTFRELRIWLKDEKNRDSLITGGLGIRDRTADYYRVLVGLPDAVKVDTRVENFLKDADIDVRKYDYKELRSIVQLAAKQLGKRPIDLDSAIWNHQGEISAKGGDMASKIYKAAQINRELMKQAREFSLHYGLAKESNMIDDMDRPTNWNLARKGTGGKTTQEFRWAVYGNYVQMWSWNQKGLPPAWKNPPRYSKALKDYLQTPAGNSWKNKHKPGWLSRTPLLPPTPTPTGLGITISLLPEQIDQLEKLAGAWSIDAPTLARIWILEHLR